MKIIGLGVDLADIERVGRLLDKYPHLVAEHPEPMLAVFDVDDGDADNLGVIDLLEEEGVKVRDQLPQSREPRDGVTTHDAKTATGQHEH